MSWGAKHTLQYLGAPTVHGGHYMYLAGPMAKCMPAWGPQRMPKVAHTPQSRIFGGWLVISNALSRVARPPILASTSMVCVVVVLVRAVIWVERLIIIYLDPLITIPNLLAHT